MKTKKLLALVLAMVMVLGLMMPGAMAADSKKGDLRDEIVTAGVSEDPNEWVTVIVELKTGTTLDEEDFLALYQDETGDFADSEEVAAYREALVAEQEAVKAQIAQIQSAVEFRYHYTNLLNGFAAKVQVKDIAAIEALESVEAVYRTMTYNYSDAWEKEDDGEEYDSLEDYYAANGDYGVALMALGDDPDETVEIPEGDDVDAGVETLSDKGSIDQMGLQTAWDAGYTGKGKVVAIFDSSLRYTHELFQYMDPTITAAKPDNYKTKDDLKTAITNNAGSINLLTNGWESWFHQRPSTETGFSAAVQEKIKDGEFWYNEKVPFAVDYMDGDLEVWDEDTSSHGTHVAGISAGNAGPLDEDEPVSYENANGVLGAAYDAQIMFFKVFSEKDDFGQESDEAVFAALDDAVTLGANSFNLSLGIPNGFSTMNTYAQQGYQKAYNRAAAAGISIAVSAGNDARDSHTGAWINGYTTTLPNSSKVGFSGSLLAPMTVASAQGVGYGYKANVSFTTVSFTDAEGEAVEGLDDFELSNSIAVGDVLTGTYDVVDVGLGSEEEILAATGAAELEGALEGKVALAQRGTLTFVAKGENAEAAGAVALIMGNNSDSNSVLSGSQLNGSYPTFGMFKSSYYDQVKAAAANGLKVSFTSETRPTEQGTSYKDNGPSSFTSWGVTESLKLKPDVMTPGGNILSAGAASDTALSVKSGTSMASPNMAGAFLLIQQYVDANLSTFGVSKGTQEYTNLVNQLAASTATVYAPYKDKDSTERQNLYFSPRRQGAGMVDISKVIESKVVLHNDAAYDSFTGEAPRSKVELGDKLGDSFDITFKLHNYNDEAREFDVLACLQTDATTTDDNGRNILKSVDTYGSDIEPLKNAVMTVKSVTGGSIETDSTNINRYNTGATAAKINVPAETEVEVTIAVTLGDMTAYDAVFPNGMFLEGFVFFDSDKEDVSLPFMGFRGDWNKAPIFDTKTAYEDISEMDVKDEDYPLFYTTTLNSLAKNGDEDAEIVLGANQYGEEAWPGYNYTNAAGANKIRAYLDTQRKAGDFAETYAAFSPNGDDNADLVYADLALERNAKALCVVITDSEGNEVVTLGPEYEYFETHAGDGNGTQQVAATYGTKYNRDMAWDGTDTEGTTVADGQYTYTVYAITEYEYMNKGLDTTATPAAADVLAVLKDKDNAAVDQVSMKVKVDTAAPVVTASAVNESAWNVTVSDASGVQALGLYYDGALVGDAVKVHSTEVSYTFDLSAVKTELELEELDLTKLELQAVDYAMNLMEENYDACDFTLTPAQSSVRLGTELTLAANAPEGSSGTYTWYVATKADGSDAEAIEGETEATLTLTNASSGRYYYSCTLGELKSSTATVDVYRPSSGGSANSTVSSDTVKNEDGSTVKTETKKDGTVVETTTDAEGNKSVATTNPDGSKNVEATYTNGTKVKSELTNSGEIKVEETRKDGTKVSTAITTDGAVSAEVAIPKNVEKTAVTIPTTSTPSAGTVAVIVHEDGTREIVKDSIPGENGVTVTLSEGAKLEIVDNSKEYDDVPENYWGKEAVDFTSSRELFNGTSEKTYSPNGSMTRGMLMTVLARLDGQDTNGGENWYVVGMNWAKENNISDGTNPEGDITREQFITMLYRCSGDDWDKNEVTGFTDADSISDYAKAAMAWAVEKGILTGTPDGALNPQGLATRVEGSAMMMRYMKTEIESEIEDAAGFPDSADAFGVMALSHF